MPKTIKQARSPAVQAMDIRAESGGDCFGIPEGYVGQEVVVFYRGTLMVQPNGAAGFIHETGILLEDLGDALVVRGPEAEEVIPKALIQKVRLVSKITAPIGGSGIITP